MLELNSIYNLDCRDGLRELDENSVDLTVTSPPYDSLRTYQDSEFAWNFDIFKEVANELYRVTKPGGVVVWVVGDEVVNGGETGTSFRQALYFQEIGFKIHDTMIYEKNSSTFPARANSKRYSQIFEYMFIFTKGKIRGDIKLIADKRNKWAGWTNWGTKTQYDTEGNLVAKEKNIKPTPEFSLRTNIWKYSVSFNDKTGHPAVFPEKLAEDHILSWSNEGDVVLDPFMGSGTTAKMAMLNKRNYIGFEKNIDYYRVSLGRVGKYEGQVAESREEIEHKDEEGTTESLIVVTDNDKEEAKKVAIVNELIEQLNDYYATMSSSILKTLKLTFQSKANDRRVEEVLRERGISGYTNEDSVCTVEEPEKKNPSDDENAAKPCEAETNNYPLKAYYECEKQYTNHKDEFLRDCVEITPSHCTVEQGELEEKREDVVSEQITESTPNAYVSNPAFKSAVIGIIKEYFEGFNSNKVDIQVKKDKLLTEQLSNFMPMDTDVTQPEEEGIKAVTQGNNKRKYTYSVETKVKILGGEYENLTGTIASVNECEGKIDYEIVIDEHNVAIHCGSDNFKAIRGKRTPKSILNNPLSFTEHE